MQQILSLLIFFSMFFSCSSTKSNTDTTTNNKSNNSEMKYCVGRGGGFTGDFEEYILLENGKVYKRDFVYERDVFYKQLSALDTEYFLTKIDELSLYGEDINQPGNMSYYLEIRQGNNTINKIIWGAHSYYPPKQLEAFHKEFFEKLKQQD
ncbi:MAG: hypothetical protein COA31_002505 [Flavobacteriales bacterium]|nr:hypothetical protein [Flavobacteriales bacterium]